MPLWAPGVAMSTTNIRPLPAQRAAASLSFGLLGPLEVRRGDVLIDVRGPQERGLLALLLTAPRRVFSVGEIVDGLWGEQAPAQADRTVQSYVSRLRRNLGDDGPSLVVTLSPGYRVQVDPGLVDAEHFRALAYNGRRLLAEGRAAEAGRALRAALSLWRGEAYGEFRAPFALLERTSLEELRLAALSDRIAADLATGGGPELVPELEVLVAQHPLRERLWGALMLALYRAGRQGDALGAFRRAQSLLAGELGVDPGPELRSLEALVLAQDDRLLLPTPTGTVEVVAADGQLPGRAAELAALVSARARSERGAVVRVLVAGPPGIGKSRLLAEFANAVGTPGEPPSSVHVVEDLHRLSADELGAALEAVRSIQPPRLVVATCVWAALDEPEQRLVSECFDERVDLGPLPAAAVGWIVRLYLPPDEAAEAATSPEVVAAQGVPSAVHAAAARLAERRVSALVDAAVSDIHDPAPHLVASRLRLRDGVEELQRLKTLAQAHGTAPATHVCPYKGLAHFDIDDAPFYAGRERLVSTLAARLVESSVLCVVGPSGSGKSSLLRAGLVAGLSAGLLPGSDRWTTVVTTPTRPLPDLPAGAARTLLVVDQFEELFTALTPDDAASFMSAVAVALDRPDVLVAVAVRADYLGRLSDHPGTGQRLAAGIVLVSEMNATELTRAVELPALAAGLQVEPALVEALVQEVVGQPGALPMLSTALLALWEHRSGSCLTLEGHLRLGGVRTAVARMGESAWAAFGPQEQEMARRMLLRLAEVDAAGEPVRRRVPRDELVPPDDERAGAVLGALVGKRLLTAAQEHVEVAHEALLREWPRLRAWLDEDDAGRRLRRHLVPAASEWHRSGQSLDELYRGPRLAAAVDWAADHPADLTETEFSFLAASREAQDSEAVRRRRSVRRLRALALSLTALLVVTAGAVLVAVDRQEDAARSALQADVRALRASALTDIRLDRALLFAAQAHRLDPSSETRDVLLQTALGSPAVTALHPAEQRVVGVAEAHGGRTLVGLGFEDTLYLWDAVTRERKTVPVVLFGRSLDVSPDGQQLAVVGVQPSADFTQGVETDLHLVDLRSDPPSVRVLPRPQGVEGPLRARFATDAAVVTVDFFGVARLIDAMSGEVLRTFTPAADISDLQVLDLSPDRRFAALSDHYGVSPVSVVEIATGRLVWSSPEPDGSMASIGPEGRTLVLAGTDGAVDVVDLASGERAPLESAPPGGLIEAVWAPDGATFTGIGPDGEVVVWDATSLEPVTTLRGHRGAIEDVAYGAGGRSLHTAGADGSVLSWDLFGDDSLARTVGRPIPREVHQHTVAADGSVAAASLPGGGLRLIDVASGTTTDVEGAFGPQGGLVSTDPRGRHVAALSFPTEPEDGPMVSTVRVVDTESGSLLPWSADVEVRHSFDAKATPDGDGLLLSTDRGTRLLDIRTGEPRTQLYSPASGVVEAAGSPDGSTVALSLADGTVEVVHLADRRRLAVLDPRPVATSSKNGFAPGPLVFSPDGRWLAAGSNSGRVAIWAARTWERLDREIVVSGGFGVGSIAFSADSGSVVVAAAGTVALWELQGESRGAILDVDRLGEASGVAAGLGGEDELVFLTDGSSVSSWSTDPERLVAHACRVAGRDLTRAEWAEVLPDRPYRPTCSGES